MNILFLIGNGFDINLNMKTHYSDFYDDYIKSYLNPSKSVEKLMKNIFDYKETDLWANLESGLGKYTYNISNIEELREVYFHLNDALRLYMLDQKLEEKYLTTNVAEELKKDLFQPYHLFKPRVRRSIQDFLNPSRVGTDDVNIITFNYTYTIERIFDAGNLKIPLELGVKNAIGSKRILKSINHIHGTLNDSELIMGVNDVSQISNKQLAKDPSALSMLVKPETTTNRGDLLDEKCENLMRSAELYCLFGLSLGETDKKWWDILAERMNTSNAHIIYYAHYDKPIFHQQDLWDIERDYLNMLVDKFTDKTQDLASYMSRIHILVNSNMFKLIK